MHQRSMIVLSLLTCLIVSRLGYAGETAAPHAAWIGQDAIAVLEITQPKQLLDHLFAHR